MITQTTKSVTLGGFILSASSFQQIVRASYQAERLELWDCIIEQKNEFDFSNPSKSKLRTINLSEWTQSIGTSRIKFTPSSFECIVEAISKWNIRLSLKILILKSWGFGKNKLQPLLIKHGLENINAK